jgi:hypothetical protein
MDELESRGIETVRVPMVDPEIVKQLRALDPPLHALGWSSKRLAQEVGVWAGAGSLGATGSALRGWFSRVAERRFRWDVSVIPPRQN